MPAVTAAGRSSGQIFRPVRGRIVPIVIGVGILVGAVVLALTMPGHYGVVDRLTIAGIGVATAAFLHRYATIHARPDAAGLWVRNLGPGEYVPWEDIVAVRFSQGMPWVRLDLADGTDMAVMAIQRADGPRSGDEAQRLADLVGR
ncbi:PH domain-containing protein [Janibacter alittae]|uniref:PH domain-containing protein n=1 Tax=Janibacter alittae TaxID=3115209 RepID=A0ABZ2MDG5_9MICO